MTETENVTGEPEIRVRKNGGTARSIRVRFGEDAYLDYKENGTIPDGYDDPRPQEKSPGNKFNESLAAGAVRQMELAEQFFGSGGMTQSRECLTRAVSKAGVCIDNCKEYFGEWETSYHTAHSVLDRADQLRRQLAA